MIPTGLNMVIYDDVVDATNECNHQRKIWWDYVKKDINCFGQS